MNQSLLFRRPPWLNAENRVTALPTSLVLERRSPLPDATSQRVRSRSNRSLQPFFPERALGARSLLSKATETSALMRKPVVVLGCSTGKITNSASPRCYPTHNPGCYIKHRSCGPGPSGLNYRPCSSLLRSLYRLPPAFLVCVGAVVPRSKAVSQGPSPPRRSRRPWRRRADDKSRSNSPRRNPGLYDRPAYLGRRKYRSRPISPFSLLKGPPSSAARGRRPRPNAPTSNALPP